MPFIPSQQLKIDNSHRKLQAKLSTQKTVFYTYNNAKRMQGKFNSRCQRWIKCLNTTWWQLVNQFFIQEYYWLLICLVYQYPVVTGTVSWDTHPAPRVLGATKPGHFELWVPRTRRMNQRSTDTAESLWMRTHWSHTSNRSVWFCSCSI